MSSTGVDAIARVVVVCVLLIAGAVDRRRSLLVASCLLGVVSGMRITSPLDLSERDPSALSPVLVVLDEPVRDGRSRGWVRTEGLRPVRARVSGLRDLRGGRGTRVAGAARLRDLSRRSTPDRRHAGRSASARMDRVGVTFGDARVVAHVPPGLRERWLASLETRLGGGAGLWRALSLADAAALDPRARATVQDLGMAHLLALSGMHTAIVGAVLLWPWRHRGRRAMVFVLPVLGAWALAAGSGPSLVRAVGMVGWWVIARRGGRRSDVVDGLAVVALCELALRPHLLCGVGWWLSYSATLAVIRAATAARRWPRPIAAIAVSSAAQGATLPWVLDAFGFVNLVAPVTLLLVGPVFGIALTFGLGGIVIGSVFPVLAPWCDVVALSAGHLFGLVLRAVSPGAAPVLRAPGLDDHAWVTLLGAVAIMIWPARLAVRRRVGVALLCLTLLPVHQGPEHEWVLFDVGQGDAAVLRCGDDALVIDTGPNYGDAAPASWTLLDWLRRRRLDDVSVVITHGHLDHSGGLGALLASGLVREVILAEADADQAWAERVVLASAEWEVGIRWVAAGHILKVGHCRPKVLWPPADGRSLHTNDRSVVLSWNLADGKALSAGDLERVAEVRLEWPGPHAWLKVAHHGGDTGTDAGLLSVLAPRHALVSCGAGNRYGHPHPAVLDRLESAGTRVHRTDRCGFLRVTWPEDGGAARLDCGHPGCP